MLAFLSGVPSTHRELTWGVRELLPALAAHSLPQWQVAKPEDRGGTEWDLAQGVSATTSLSTQSSGIRVSLVSGTAHGHTRGSAHCPPDSPHHT